MNRSLLRRMLPAGTAGIAGTAALATPACAAVCPKGIGNCPYPGRCPLYTDVDGNRICDYNLTDATPDVTATAGDGAVATANVSGAET